MSNILVGAISFDSGFSTGFQTIPLGISFIEIEPLDVSISFSSRINVDETNIFIIQNDVEVNASVNASVNQSLVEILPHDATASASVNADVNESLVEILPRDVTFITSVNISVNESLVEILPHDAAASASVNASVNESLVEILPFDATASTSVNASTNESFIEILPLDSTVTASVNATVNQSLVEILPNNATAVASVNASVNQSLVEILPNDNEIHTGANISTSYYLIEIITNNVSVVASSIIEDNNTIVDILSNDVYVTAGVTIECDNSVIIIRGWDSQTDRRTRVDVLNSVVLINPWVIDGVGTNKNWDECPAYLNNPFWDKDSSCRDGEAMLYDKLWTGAVNQYGVNAVWYVVDYSLSNENIFGEDNDRHIVRNFNLKYYIEQLPQDDRMWSKIGIEGLDVFHIYVTKSHFLQMSQLNMNGNIAYNSYLPKPGDILLSTHNNVFYEVIDVKDKIEMFLQRSHTWDIVLRPNIVNHYSVSQDLTCDPIYKHMKQIDMLQQNDVIDTEKTNVLYNDPNGDIDPFGLF